MGKKCYMIADSLWIIDNGSKRCTKVYYNTDLGLISVFPGPGSKLTVTAREGSDPLFRTFQLDLGVMKVDGVCWLGRNPELLDEMAKEIGWKPPNKTRSEENDE